MDINKYKHQWRYTDEERQSDLCCVCYDCGLAYGQFPDMVVPNELWEKINPTYHKGSGILCPTCMANRLDYIDKWYEGDLFILKVKEN